MKPYFKPQLVVMPVRCHVLFGFFFCYFFSLDHSKGFGGKYGVQKDRVDKVHCLSKL